MKNIIIGKLTHMAALMAVLILGGMGAARFLWHIPFVLSDFLTDAGTVVFFSVILVFEAFDTVREYRKNKKA